MIVPNWGHDSAAELKPAIKLADVSAGYGDTTILQDVSLEVERGEFLVIEGASGAGKTTLLRLLYGTVRPRSGVAVVDGVDLTRLRDRQVPGYRRRLGFVFQNYELLPQLTALENVALPLQLAHGDIPAPRRQAAEVLERIGLADSLGARPQELSGGEQQRVAIARAIAHEPRILLADEPTGNLDRVATDGVMDAFEDYHGRGGTVVVATHDEGLRDRHARRVLRVEAVAA
jgi:cell division transport system ATP-binding protein